MRTADSGRTPVRHKINFQIESHKSLDSTNTLTLRYAAEGKPEGWVVTADFQTHGRGKPGNVWFSSAGENLLFSVLLRPPVKASAAPMITQMACRAVRSVLKEAGLQTNIKPPNDLMVGVRKICGILVETSSGTDGTLGGVVVGFGLNVGSSPEALGPKATSLAAEIGKAPGREKILAKILTALEQEVQPFYARPA
jgi:BirA family biotin operon repressor/biotin-[acetyl-CoA-carboxylase] ligase